MSPAGVSPPSPGLAAPESRSFRFFGYVEAVSSHFKYFLVPGAGRRGGKAAGGRDGAAASQGRSREGRNAKYDSVRPGDADGSVEAIVDILATYDEHDTVRLELVHCGVGPATPNDVEVSAGG